MKVKTLVVPLLLLAALLGACGTQQEAAAYTLSLWYAEDAPFAAAVQELAEDYNRSRERGSLAVSLRAFPDESALTRAVENGALPDLLLCSHSLAFRLQEQEALKEFSVSAPAYPAWLLERSGCVGHGYYPVGSSLPLLCCRGDMPLSWDELCEQAAAYTAEAHRLE